MKLLVGMLYTLLPELVLFTTALVLATSTFSGAGQLAAELGAAAILIAALGLSAQFNRSRMFFALLTLLSAYLALYALTRITDPLAHAGVGGALSLFLPLDILVFVAIPERGVFSRYGGLWFGLLALEFLSLWILAAFPSPLLAHALHVEFVRSSFLSFEPITQPGMLLFAFGLLWLNDRLLSRHSAETAAFFLALVATLPVLHTPLLARAAVFLAATGLAFGYAVIQESWSMAYLDELTGLPGRRALEEQMRQLGGRYAIAMVDVDHFKRFNDSYGHDVGDQVLRFVASRLQQPGFSGKPFRYGGEEFSVLYAGYGLAEVRSELETLRSDIEACRFDLRQRGRRSADGLGVEAGPSPEMLSITVSIGTAESSLALKEPWAVLKAADKALYDAKHAGRNRVIAGTG